MNRLLTRDDYSASIDAYFEIAKREFMEYIALLSKDDFKRLALQRWDDAVPDYGDQADLTAKDYPEEADEEAVDGIGYWVMEIEREARDL